MRTPIRSVRWRFLMWPGVVAVLVASSVWSAPNVEPPSGEPSAESVSLPSDLPTGAVDLTDKVEVTVRGKLRSTSGNFHSVVFTLKNITEEDLKGPIVVLVDETGIKSLELTQTDGTLSDDRPYVEIVSERSELKAGKTLRSEKLQFKTEAALTLAERELFDLKLRVCRYDEAAALAAQSDDADKIPGKSYGWKEFDKVAAVQEKWTMPLIRSGNGEVYGTAVSEDDNGELVVTVYTERPGTDDVVPETIDGIPVVIQPIGQMFRAGPARNDLIYPNGRPRKGAKGNEEDFLPVPDEGPTAEGDTKPSGTSSPLPVILDPTVRFTRPVPIGVSISNADQLFFNPDLFNCYSGTLGCRCVDALGMQYILTNLHVGGALNLPFDTPLVMTAIVGDRIVQPSTGDMASTCTIDPSNVIGVVADFQDIIVPQDELEQLFFTHLMDTCVIRADPGAVGFAPPADGYPILNRNIVDRPYIGMEVKKYGRTTIYTTGMVTGLNVATLVGYGNPDQLGSIFLRQISVANLTAFGQPFGGPGDSGSLIVQNKPGTPEDGRPLGLLYAGGPRGAIDITLANPIGPILTRYGLQVDDGSGAPFQAGQSGTMGGAIAPVKPPSSF